VPGGHHPRRTVEHGTEVVPVSQLGLPGGQSHSHRQLQLPLRVDRGVHGTHRRREGRTYTVTGVLEQEPALCLNRRVQHLVVCG